MAYKKDMGTQIEWVKTRLSALLESKLHFPVIVDDEAANIIAQKRVFGGNTVWLKGVERSDIQLALVINSAHEKKQNSEQQLQITIDDLLEPL